MILSHLFAPAILHGTGNAFLIVERTVETKQLQISELFVHLVAVVWFSILWPSEIL